jgi:hypothetical protein
MVAHADNQASSITGQAEELAAPPITVSAPPSDDSEKRHDDSLYTWSTTLSVAGLASALWVMLGALSSAFTWAYPGWVPLLLALALVIVSDVAQQAAKRVAATQPLLPRALLWFLNSCLVYTTALGGAHAVQPISPAEKVLAKVDIAAHQVDVAGTSGPAISSPDDPRPAPPSSASTPKTATKPQTAPSTASTPNPDSKPRTRTAPSLKPSSKPEDKLNADSSPAIQVGPRARASVPISALQDAVRSKPQPGFNRLADSALLR